MGSKKKVLAIICARGGSKGLPQKNIKMLAGRPLLAWTIDAARKSDAIDRLILSSDDEKIMEVAQQFQCEVPFIRPKELAADHSKTSDVVVHAINAIGDAFEYAVILQPTSPLRTAKDISACVDLCRPGVNSVVSITESDKNPYWMFEMKEGNLLRPVMVKTAIPFQRQEIPPTFVINGAVYVVRIDWFLKHQKFIDEETVAYVMPRERSVDIDTELDFYLAEKIMERNF